MSLLEPKESKPQTSLQEKTSGFKFQLPATKGNNEANAETTAQVESVTTADKPNVNTVQNSPAKNGSLLGATQPEKPAEKKATPIPALGDEKYVLVADATPEISEEMAARLRGYLQRLEDTIDDDHQLQDVLKQTLEYLSEHKELKAILAPEDRAVFVRACRKSYGITLTSKKKNKTKTKKLDAKVEDIMADLTDMEFDL
jgi:hypothetical protein